MLRSLETAGTAMIHPPQPGLPMNSACWLPQGLQVTLVPSISRAPSNSESGISQSVTITSLPTFRSGSEKTAGLGLKGHTE
jgi:hypothetical protein